MKCDFCGEETEHGIIHEPGGKHWYDQEIVEKQPTDVKMACFPHKHTSCREEFFKYLRREWNASST